MWFSLNYNDVVSLEQIPTSIYQSKLYLKVTLLGVV